jgi:Spy/CpxP family protein refolding chaperone
MKRSLMALLSAGLITGTGLAIAQGHGPGAANGGPHGWRHGNPLEHMTETLNLTPDQKAKIQPIIDQAKPEMQAIHQEAMQKANTVMDKTMAQIRPLLTPEQQKKADDMRQAHEQMRDAMKKMHDAKSE